LEEIDLLSFKERHRNSGLLGFIKWFLQDQKLILKLNHLFLHAILLIFRDIYGNVDLI